MIYKEVKLYEDRDDVTLTTYVLNDSVEMLNGGKRGAVLICPGGAYLYCSDREGEPVAMAFSAMGYQAFVLKYSVYNENNGDNRMEAIVPDMSKPWEVKEKIAYPAPMRDIGKALLCIREHADEWFVDMNRISLCGFSAGAHNCAMYSVNYNKPVITEYLGIEECGIRPTTAILGYTLGDYAYYLENTPDNPAHDLMEASMYAYMGKKAIPTPEEIEKYSPCRLVNESTPPMFLWATAKDNLVDPANTLKMALALNEKKIPYELHIFEEGVHGMVLGNQATASGKMHMDRDIEGWIDMVDSWLRKRMYHELPDEKNGF